ncbi:MAG: leucine-rich repeat domain-containing protein [Bacteroidales bacterium]|nr:leucine-rich repeat domain-containing protein [Bacteroidales bacterium]
MKQNKLGGLAIAATLAAMLFGGCQKDNTTLRIQMARFDGGSKVTMDGYTSYWSNGDNVMINEVSETIASDGHTVSVDVPTAAVYKAIYPAEYASSDMTHLDIPETQVYAVDAEGRQKVMAPMGAFSESSTLQFTPMCSLLEVEVANGTSRGSLTVNKIVVKASSAALWGGATVHDLTNSNRSYTIDNPYSEGVNDSVILSAADGASMGVSVAANSTKTFYVCIPAISPEVSNRFTITVYATDANGDNFCYTHSQQNAYGGNIPNGRLAEVPFSLTSDNEAEIFCTIYYTTYLNRNNLEGSMESLARENSTSIRAIIQLPNGSYAAAFNDPITVISTGAFLGSDLTSITIPNSVTSIETEAFTWCMNLTSVTIPNSVTYIGDHTFNDCMALTRVTIPNSVTYIGEYAFTGCWSLASVTIGNSVEHIGVMAFGSCSSLTSVTIPNSVEYIGDQAFQYCNGLTSVTIGNSVTYIGDYAFDGCSALTSVTIPNSVTSIKSSTFKNCSGLTSVTIPNSVTNIEIQAFDGCSALTSVTIPNSVEYIGAFAFRNCSSLTSVTCLRNTPPTLETNAFYSIQSNAVLHVPSGCTGNYSGWSSYFGGGIRGDATM